MRLCEFHILYCVSYWSQTWLLTIAYPMMLVDYIVNYLMLDPVIHSRLDVSQTFSYFSRGRGRARKRKYRRYQSSTAPSCSSSSSSSSEESYVSDRSCERSCERQRCVSSSDSDSTSSSCDSCYSGASNISPSTKRKYRMVRKSRRKRSVGASTCRKSKKSR